jgi:acyl-CoA synthetase (AMP-forming)/AMP-acid ligase II
MSILNFLNDNITEEDTYNYTLPDILSMRAEYTPGETAYLFLVDGENQEERITYGELDRDARAIADKLLAMDVRGERALLLFPTGLNFIRALYSCFISGVIAVPAYPPRKNRSLERLRLMVIDSGATIILTNDEICKTFERSFSDVEELKNMKWISVNSLMQTQPVSSSNINQSPNPQDIALLQYTSGSTGQPKGVMVTHHNIMRNVEYIRQSFKLTTKSVSVTWLPSFHDMGLIDGVIEPLYTGFPGIFMNPVNFLQKPSRWFNAISKYRGTHCGAPNFAFDLCVEEITEEEKSGMDLSSLHTLYCGAEPIYRETLDRFIQTFRINGLSPNAIYPCYGMAETTLIITGPNAHEGYRYLGISDKEFSRNRVVTVSGPGSDTKYLVSVGFPWLDTTVRIVHPDTFIECNDREIGEIWVKGSIVTAGYWGNEASSSATFKAELLNRPGEKYLRTGDLGFISDGELFISGRLKDMIIIYGRNIYPQDIERLVESCHPAIRANCSAAFSLDVERQEKLVVVAEVERSAIHNLDVEEVCDRIRIKIAEEKELAVFGIQLIRTASIPKTSSGKIQRKVCKQAFLERSLDVIGESFIGEFHIAGQEIQQDEDLCRVMEWLINWISHTIEIPRENIDLSNPLVIYGIDKPHAYFLENEIKTLFNLDIKAELFFENIPLEELFSNALAQRRKICT